MKKQVGMVTGTKVNKQEYWLGIVYESLQLFIEIMLLGKDVYVGCTLYYYTTTSKYSCLYTFRTLDHTYLLFHL